MRIVFRSVGNFLHLALVVDFSERDAYITMLTQIEVLRLAKWSQQTFLYFYEYRLFLMPFVVFRNYPRIFSFCELVAILFDTGFCLHLLTYKKSFISYTYYTQLTGFCFYNEIL